MCWHANGSGKSVCTIHLSACVQFCAQSDPLIDFVMPCRACRRPYVDPYLTDLERNRDVYITSACTRHSTHLDDAKPRLVPMLMPRKAVDCMLADVHVPLLVGFELCSLKIRYLPAHVRKSLACCLLGSSRILGLSSLSHHGT